VVRFSSPRFNLSRKYFLNKQLVEPVDLPEWCWTHASFVGVVRVHETRQIGGPSGTLKTYNLLKSGSTEKAGNSYIRSHFNNLLLLTISILPCLGIVSLQFRRLQIKRGFSVIKPCWWFCYPLFCRHLGFVGVFFSERNDSKLINIELFVPFSGVSSTLGCTLTNWQCLHERKYRKSWFKRSK